ncbi:MAG: MGH1-like glycoside hydrolase domain-containing protein [Terriglobia bacterium]
MGCLQLIESNLNRVYLILTLLAVFCLTCGLFAQERATAQNEPRFDRVVIESLDPDAWNGVVFMAKAYQQQISFGLRVGSHRGHLLDGEKIFGAVSEVGPHAPDASYCRVSWRHPPLEAPVTLEWSRIDETTVVGRLNSAQGLQLVLETYFPNSAGGTSGTYAVDASRRAILGEKFFDKVFNHVARLVVMTDRPLVGSGAYPSLADLQSGMDSAGLLAPPAPNDSLQGAAGLEFADSAPAHFVAVMGWDKESLLNHASALLAPGKIDAILREKAEGYAARRPSVEGLFAGAPEAIGNSMFWNTLYAPQFDLIFPSISRQWAHGWGGWAVGEWDCFFGALLTSLEDAAQTSAGIRAILSSQTDLGVVPNVASQEGISPDRSQPPVGSYVVWKVYQRQRDRDLLEWAYPRLKKWHEWWLADRGDGQPWRDGNRDGLLEWGSDRGSTPSVGGRGNLQAARWESGMDDSPLYDDVIYDPRTYTMNLADVGLNSLYTLDAECLAKIAAILGRDEDSRKFAAEYEHMKQLVREKLWNDKDGIYENLFWDGRFSGRLSTTNFYPLFAGIATPKQAERMIKEHLLNPKQFWGQYVAPTIARDDPAFPDQFYWRGDIWGPTNYMLYEGVNRYRFDEVARDYAQKNYDLFMDDWRRNQHDNEQYYAWGGSAGGDTHYTWGALLCLAPLEQYIDVNPWEGLRFGALDPPTQGNFRRTVWGNHTYDIAIGPNKTVLSRDGQERFEANAGVVVRNYQTSASQLTFSLKATRPVTAATMEFENGELNLRIDGKPAGKAHVQQGRASFQLSAGEHAIELTK